MLASFPTSKLMMGSVIPGVRQQLPEIRIATYPDHTDEPLLLKRRPASVNPMVQFPSMNQDHAKGHGFLEKLKKLMEGQQHSGVYGPHQGPASKDGLGIGPPQPKMMEGYQPISENRDWRYM
mgnify:CR=1 FL=1|jgi:hypothetical protein